MRIVYATFAWLVFTTHVLFGIWLLTGWLFERWEFLYVASLGVWIGSWVVLGYCPLTVLEFWFRSRGGEVMNLRAEFIQYYVWHWLGIRVSNRVIYTSGVFLFFVLVGMSIWS
jgi:hypothetical protein